MSNSSSSNIVVLLAVWSWETRNWICIHKVLLHVGEEKKDELKKAVGWKVIYTKTHLCFCLTLLQVSFTFWLLEFACLLAFLKEFFYFYLFHLKTTHIWRMCTIKLQIGCLFQIFLDYVYACENTLNWDLRFLRRLFLRR